MGIKTNFKSLILIIVICSIEWFHPATYASIAVQNSCPYQSKLSYGCNQAWVNKYLQAPSFLYNYNHDQFPRAMMPMELPDIFTNPSKPKEPEPNNTPKEIIPAPGG